MKSKCMVCGKEFEHAGYTGQFTGASLCRDPWCLITLRKLTYESILNDTQQYGNNARRYSRHLFRRHCPPIVPEMPFEYVYGYKIVLHEDLIEVISSIPIVEYIEYPYGADFKVKYINQQNE